MGDCFGVVFVFVIYVFCCDYCVDDSFFVGLCGGFEQWIDVIVVDEIGLLQWLVVQCFGVGGGECYEDVVGIVVGVVFYVCQFYVGVLGDVF